MITPCEYMDDPVGPIRVVVANLSSAILQTLTDQIKQQNDMELTGQAQDAVEVLTFVSENVDVLVLGAEQGYNGGLPGICSHLLTEYPRLKILVIGSNSGVEASTLYWLGLRKWHSGEINTTALLSNIRYAHKLNPTV